MVETIFTKHPQKGRSGKEVSKQKYDAIRAAITEILTISEPLTLQELVAAVEERLSKTPFPGEIGWFVNVVRLDLQARKYVQEITEGKRTKYRLWPELPL